MQAKVFMPGVRAFHSFSFHLSLSLGPPKNHGFWPFSVVSHALSKIYSSSILESDITGGSTISVFGKPKKPPLLQVISGYHAYISDTLVTVEGVGRSDDPRRISGEIIYASDDEMQVAGESARTPPMDFITAAGG